jgi:hypothetical protein
LEGYLVIWSKSGGCVSLGIVDRLIGWPEKVLLLHATLDRNKAETLGLWLIPHMQQSQNHRQYTLKLDAKRDRRFSQSLQCMSSG